MNAIKFWLVCILAFALFIAVTATYNTCTMPRKPRCVRSHVEVNNVPEHYACRVKRDEACLTYDLVPAERVQTPVCDEYEQTK